MRFEDPTVAEYIDITSLDDIMVRTVVMRPSPYFCAHRDTLEMTYEGARCVECGARLDAEDVADIVDRT